MHGKRSSLFHSDRQKKIKKNTEKGKEKKKMNKISFILPFKKRKNRVFTPSIVDNIKNIIEKTKDIQFRYQTDGKLDLSLPGNVEDAPLITPEQPKIPNRKIIKIQKNIKLREFLKDVCPEQIINGKVRGGEDQLRAKHICINDLLIEKDDIAEFYRAHKDFSSSDTLDAKKPHPSFNNNPENTSK